MQRDASQCNTYNYGGAVYWDGRYIEEGVASFDWYQRYSALRPFLRMFVPSSSRVLMVGCGNALMSEDMVRDGYINIMNIDISSVVIEIMRKKYAHIPQMNYMQMDVRDMSFFDDESFDCVIDKVWYRCSTQFLPNAKRSEQITYGDPSVRVPRLNQARCNWKITLYIIPRPGFQSRAGCSSSKSIMEPVPLTEKGLLPASFVLEDPDSLYIYICQKMDGLREIDTMKTGQVEAAIAQ